MEAAAWLTAFIVVWVTDAYLFTQGYDTLFFTHKTSAEKQLQQRIIMSKQLNPQIVNPAYVQISKKEAAAILGFSVTELDNRRKTDPHCPKGFQQPGAGNNPVKFRLSDVYTYSEYLMNQAEAASN